MGLHRLNYKATLRRHRPSAYEVAAAVTTCTLLSLIFAAITVVLVGLLVLVLAAGRGPIPWTFAAILAGTIVACAWGGIAIVHDMYRSLRRSDVDTDSPGAEPASQNRPAGD